MTTFSSRELALHAARLCLDKGADDVRVMTMPEGHGVFDYIVLATARSDRQTHAVVDEVYHFCKRHHVPHHPVEGSAGWMLIDCMDVVVHAFGEEERARYAIDALWPKARDLDVEKELKKLADPDKAPAASTAKPTGRAGRRRSATAAGSADVADAGGNGPDGTDDVDGPGAAAPAPAKPARRASARRGAKPAAGED